MSKTFTEKDDALLKELGVEVEPEKSVGRTRREERIFAGFEEIQRFVDSHGRSPRDGEGHNIFERLQAVRLGSIREQEECRTLLKPVDRQGLLAVRRESDLPPPDKMDDETLLAELGVETAASNIMELRHVRSAGEKRAAEDIASRRKCGEFDKFAPLFKQIQNDLDTGIRKTRPFELISDIEPGRFFVVGGQKAYVADMGEEFIQDYGDKDARLRVIFDNGTENNMLRRSLQRALHKDGAGRKITDPDDPIDFPLFADRAETGDEASGTIYVLRSKSDEPYIAENRDLVHKIGVTSGDVEKRIARTRRDPTYLMADVEVVATYKLYNINRSKLENLIHRIFASARLEIEIKDRFGNPVMPREWFLVPLHVIDDAVGRIMDGTITGYLYDANTASLVEPQ